MNIKKLYSQALKEYKAKKFDAALKTLDKIKKLAPNYHDAYFLESHVWHELKNFVKEYAARQKILPYLDVSSRKGKISSAAIFYDMGNVCYQLAWPEKACTYYYRSVNLTNDEKIFRDSVANALFAANCSEFFTAADFHVFYDEFKKILVNIKPYPKKFYDHKKIRVGFLSSDFKNHAVIFWSWELLTKLNRKFFTPYYYSNVKEPDPITELLKKNRADTWRDITKLTDAEAAALIRDDEIDILFDLNGFTTDTRFLVAAYRPASVQMTGVGYMNSTGLDCLDFFLSDAYLTENVQVTSEYFTEKVLRMPHSHICYTFFRKIEPPPQPPCVKNDYVTFGSFNQYRKITDSILRAWAKILDAVPNSRLLLKTRIYDTDDGRKFVGERLKSFGIDLSRVEMRGYSKNHLEEYAEMDIALDTFPYTGGVTTCEALYMGVPVVSLYGDRPGSRFGYSILKNVGLDELAVESYDDYVGRAVALANDWELIRILRKNLRGMMKRSPLMDAKGYIRAVEKVFVAILDASRKTDGVS